MKPDNVIFYGQRPLEDMPELYKIADAMLVTLEDKPYANMTIPGKVQSYMAAGKPIVGSVNGSCANFIKENEIGYVCAAGDSGSLSKLIQSININELHRISKHVKSVYLKGYNKNRFINFLMDELKNY